MGIWIQKYVLVENAVLPFLARLISHLLLTALSDKSASKAKKNRAYDRIRNKPFG